MEKRSFLLVANPVSGSGSGIKIAERVGDVLRQHHPVDIFYTKGEQHIKDNLLQQTQGHSDIVIVGGDGTIHQVVNALGAHHRATLSLIPAGTGNDFAKVLDLGRGIDEQINSSLHGKVRELDLGVCNERLFVNGVGIGFDGQIVYEMLHKKTWLKGHAAYYYHVLRILAGYKERPFEYSLDGESQKKDLILMTIGNGTTFGGGFKLTPNARPDDGWLDICLIGKLSPIKRFLNVPSLSNGSHLKLKAIEEQRVKRLEVAKSDLLEGHIDGEYLGRPPYSIKIFEKALKVRERN